MGVTVVIPTVDGREEYLERAIKAYRKRTPTEVQIVVPRNRPTCGIAWQEGSGQAVLEYLHLTADDILPEPGWFEAMQAVVAGGGVPCGLVRTPLPETLDEDYWPIEGAPSGREAFFERESSRSVVADGYVAGPDNEYPAIPFCSIDQWRLIEPMVASHYGTDKWFGYRAKQAGFPNVVTHGAHFWHYAAHAGRTPVYEGGAAWTHIDRLDFDLSIAWQMYVNGSLKPHELHPEWNTPGGREIARTWRRAHIGPPFPWDDPNLGPEFR